MSEEINYAQLEEELIKMYEKDPDSAWLELMGIIMTSNFPEEMLKHHGIDGQKWGIKNGPPYPLSRKNKHLNRSSKVKILMDNIDDLSLEEIEKLMKRIELETKLENWAAEEKKKGKSYAERVLVKVGDALLNNAVPAATNYAFKKIVEAVGGDEVALEMFPKKK